MAQLALKMALSHYDRHIPFFDGTVRPEGIDLTVLEVGESIPLKHGSDRHGRMLDANNKDNDSDSSRQLGFGAMRRNNHAF